MSVATLTDQLAAEQRRAELFGSFLDSISRPTPAMLRVQALADSLRERDGFEVRENRKDAAVALIRARDGDGCWYCGKGVSPREQSIEHLQPLSKGGGWDESNVVLAHQSCNQAAGDLGIVAKLKLRDAARVSL